MAEAIVAPDTLDPRQLLTVLTAFKKGDFTTRMPLDRSGVVGKVADMLNDVVEMNVQLLDELGRLRRDVGAEGRTSERGALSGAGGGWKRAIGAVNELITDMARPTNEIARVVGGVAAGDLRQLVALEVGGNPLKGDFLQTAKTVNSMVEQLSTFSSEVTRVAREVGAEGKLGGQALVPGVSGTWKDLTDNVNMMAANLTGQVRNIAEVTIAVANGDLNRKIIVDARGEILQLKDAINTMVDQLRVFAAEVTRVAREVGTDGKLGGQSVVLGVAGTWKDLTDSVNGMATNLTRQVRNIAEVTTAVANGNLNRKITVEAQGEILELKNTINTMVDQLNAFAGEVTRVAREVGTEGQLGGQAQVKGVGGTWKDLTDSVNGMATNLTNQVRNIAEVTTAVANGDLTKKITVDVRGEVLQLKNTINGMVDQLNGFAGEVTRVAREVGTEGTLGGQAVVRGVGGVWKELTDNVNGMASNLTGQVRNIAEVTTAVANGDLSRTITVDAKGEILELKNTINTMVDQLNGFASEVTRVAREVGTEGKLGGQAQVKGVGGTWKDLTDSVNSMATNLTTQVRSIARIVTAVANGDLRRNLVLEARGEIAQLAETINSMIDTLALFAQQVTGVARDVGIEGRLGGQATVPGAAGLWRELTDNVNQLAANLTIQVRAIGEVATAVTQGDLSRSIAVEAAGEVAVLKDNLNRMIGKLKETTRKNEDQDWLKTNVAKLTRMLQGQRDLRAVSTRLLAEIAPLVDAQHGVFYMADDQGTELQMLSAYAYKERKNLATRWKFGEGLVGQCAMEKQRMTLTHVPGDYIQISSGLGEASPLTLMLLPVLFEGQVKAVIELASFNRYSEIHTAFLEQLAEGLGVMINAIGAVQRTEVLLKESQTLAAQLQNQQTELQRSNVQLQTQAEALHQSEEQLKAQQEELQQANEELEERARLLGEQKGEVERKNREIDRARALVEDKAAQLVLTSKYKSEFLANMSHDLRTPLNSLLILAKMLADNPQGNLDPKQVEWAATIYGAGGDLLNLIDDVLDLSKIEAGMMAADVSDVQPADAAAAAERTFRQVAEAKGLAFTLELAGDVPETMQTDSKRLQQIVKNLLSNAFKFTEKGGVRLGISVAREGWSEDHETLNEAGRVLAFAVEDSGVGIAKDKQMVIWQAFQQADGSTSRKYGGTGLGLSISRELAKLLGGEIRLVSEPGKGSTFTLYLPADYIPPRRNALALETPFSPGPGGSEPREGMRDRRSWPRAETAGRALDPSLAESARAADDRGRLAAGDRVLLIVEDDAEFARVLLDLARERGFKGVVAGTVAAALALARELRPAAITLDIQLPDGSGWSVLDALKHDPATRHIPVHVISVVEERQRGMRLGALRTLTKPATKEQLEQTLASIREFAERPVRRLLVVEDDAAQRQATAALIGNGDVETVGAASGAEAIEALKSARFDCMVLDLGLPDMSGAKLIERVQSELGLADLPIIVYTGKALTPKEETELHRVADAIVVKDVGSPERLLDETALFLHRVEAALPPAKRRMIEQVRKKDPLLAGKKVLVVDDDVRNIFALTSVLEAHDVKVSYVENGREALATLKKDPDVDAVLMDIMMPEMDGYETTRAIRKIGRFKKLPILALTAKAMKGDREKCLEAGASDYISKPINTDQLLSLLRVWMYK